MVDDREEQSGSKHQRAPPSSSPYSGGQGGAMVVGVSLNGLRFSIFIKEESPRGREWWWGPGWVGAAEAGTGVAGWKVSPGRR